MGFISCTQEPHRSTGGESELGKGKCLDPRKGGKGGSCLQEGWMSTVPHPWLSDTIPGGKAAHSPILGSHFGGRRGESQQRAPRMSQFRAAEP